jgi:hypothetical protein
VASWPRKHRFKSITSAGAIVRLSAPNRSEALNR